MIRAFKYQNTHAFLRPIFSTELKSSLTLTQSSSLKAFDSGLLLANFHKTIGITDLFLSYFFVLNSAILLV